jgi:DNA-binding transcriptional LysR family regulator
MSDRLQQLTAFVRAGQTGSFSRVARELRVSQPSISRMVASLEARLGVKLLLRTTRRVTPTDLAGHDCILGPGLSGASGWRFTRAGRATSVTVEGPIKVASADGVVACAKAGLGIALASRWMCRAELEAGDLVAILSNYQLDGVELHAVYPAGRRPTVKARAFSDYFATELVHNNEDG